MERDKNLKNKICIFFLSVMAMSAVYFPTCAKENIEHCLEDIWNKKKSPEIEKQFDIENDIDFTGNRFSCYNKISATNVKNIFERFNHALLDDNIDELAKLVRYPLILMPKLANPNDDGSIYYFIEINNKEELHLNYAKLATPLFRKIMSCASVSNARVVGNFGILLADGNLYFNRIDENNPYDLGLSMYSEFYVEIEKWLVEFCQ